MGAANCCEIQQPVLLRRRPAAPKISLRQQERSRPQSTMAVSASQAINPFQVIADQRPKPVSAETALNEAPNANSVAITPKPHRPARAGRQLRHKSMVAPSLLIARPVSRSPRSSHSQEDESNAGHPAVTDDNNAIGTHGVLNELHSVSAPAVIGMTSSVPSGSSGNSRRSSLSQRASSGDRERQRQVSIVCTPQPVNDTIVTVRPPIRLLQKRRESETDCDELLEEPFLRSPVDEFESMDSESRHLSSPTTSATNSERGFC